MMELFFFRKNGTGFVEETLELLLPTERKSRMFWSVILYDGVKCLLLSSDRINSRKYLKVWEAYDEKMLCSESVFHRNNPPMHKVASSKIFLQPGIGTF